MVAKVSYELGIMMYRAYTFQEISEYRFLDNFLILGRDLLDIVNVKDLKEGFIMEAEEDGVDRCRARGLFREYYKDLTSKINIG